MRKYFTGFILALFFMGVGEYPASANTIFSFTGNLRADANFTDCGSGCTLGASNSDADYAQFAAVSRTFHVQNASPMEAITFSYGGGINGQSTVIAERGFEPYLSLFDVSGNFLASTFFGTTCPPGAQTNSGSGQCFDVALDGGVLAPGDYQIAISAFENLSFAENLGTGALTDGFIGFGSLFPGEDMHYAFDVILTAPETTPAPEPGLFWPLAIGTFALYGSGKIRKGQQS